MNMHARPADINTHGRNVSDIGQELLDGTRKGRSLRLVTPGLAVAAAFDGYRDAWLGQGEQISIDLDDTGQSTTKSSVNHQENEDAIERGYKSIHP